MFQQIQVNLLEATDLAKRFTVWLKPKENFFQHNLHPENLNKRPKGLNGHLNIMICERFSNLGPL